MVARVFISYSRDNVDVKDALARHLAVLQDRLDYWDDSKIAPGANWEQELNRASSGQWLPFFWFRPARSPRNLF